MNVSNGVSTATKVPVYPRTAPDLESFRFRMKNPARAHDSFRDEKCLRFRLFDRYSWRRAEESNPAARMKCFPMKKHARTTRQQTFHFVRGTTRSPGFIFFSRLERAKNRMFESRNKILPYPNSSNRSIRSLYPILQFEQTNRKKSNLPEESQRLHLDT